MLSRAYNWRFRRRKASAARRGVDMTLRDPGLEFSGGLAAKNCNGWWGYVNEADDWVILPQFNEADKFSEGMALVRLGCKYGSIDKAGQCAIPLQFDAPYRFSEGLAAVKVGCLWGYIDRTGRRAIPFQFAEAGDFSGGIAQVKELGGTCCCIDKAGDKVPHRGGTG